MARARDPGGRYISLFDLFQVWGAFGGAVTTFYYVARAWGMIAGITATVPGFLLGGIIGHLPWVLAGWLMRRSLKNSSTQALWAQMSEEWWMSTEIVPVLMERGEPPRAFQDQFLLQLLSECSERRWEAWRTLNVCFPEVVERLSGINPLGSPDAYRSRVEQICTER